MGCLGGARHRWLAAIRSTTSTPRSFGTPQRAGIRICPRRERPNDGRRGPARARTRWRRAPTRRQVPPGRIADCASSRGSDGRRPTSRHPPPAGFREARPCSWCRGRSSRRALSAAAWPSFARGGRLVDHLAVPREQLRAEPLEVGLGKPAQELPGELEGLLDAPALTALVDEPVLEVVREAEIEQLLEGGGSDIDARSRRGETVTAARASA